MGWVEAVEYLAAPLQGEDEAVGAVLVLALAAGQRGFPPGIPRPSLGVSRCQQVSIGPQPQNLEAEAMQPGNTAGVQRGQDLACFDHALTATDTADAYQWLLL